MENSDRSLFLSATKRPFPAAATDKTFLSLCCLFLEEDQRSGCSIFGIHWGILDGRLSLRLNGFVSTPDYTGRQNAVSGALVFCTVKIKQPSGSNGVLSTPSLVLTRFLTRSKRRSPQENTDFFHFSTQMKRGLIDISV